MKDIVISRQCMRYQLRVFALCIFASLALNVYSIIRFKTHWAEVLTTFHITLAIAVVFFLLVVVLRSIAASCRSIARRKAKWSRPE